MASPMEEIRSAYQVLIAKRIGLPVDFFRRTWKGPYDPEKHLFYRNKETGGVEAVWANEQKIWEKLTEGYLLWFLVPEGMQHLFWETIYKLQVQTPDYEKADIGFKMWLANKATPGGLLGLLGGPTKSHGPA